MIPGLHSAAPLRLGTRRSPLALAQAEEARRRLCTKHRWPLDQVEIVPVTASGDRIQDRPLAEIGGKALWTKELDAALLSGMIDLAVHSAKDVETVRLAGIAIAAVLPREDVRDVLILREAPHRQTGASGLAALPHGARVGTSAPRRAAQLLHLRPDCRIVPFRGNVATRLARLDAGEAEATLLAKAGLNRLGQGEMGLALTAEDWLPAPGQGAIIIECRADDLQTRAQVAAVNDSPSNAAVMAERALLAALGGNCHSPIAVLTRQAGNRLTLHAALYSPDGRARIDGTANFAIDDLAAPAALAADLLDRAPAAITATFGGPSPAAS